jgi:hypothetical protein
MLDMVTGSAAMAWVSRQSNAMYASDGYNGPVRNLPMPPSQQRMQMHDPPVPDGSENERRQIQSMDWGDLMSQAGQGSELAIGQLAERYSPLLSRWAHARLTWNHADPDTDAVQTLEGIVHSRVRDCLKHYAELGVKREGTLLLGLRDAVNAGLQAWTRKTSVLEETFGPQRAASYEEGLTRLQSVEREAVICVLEFHRSPTQLKSDLATSSVDEARDLYARAVVRLAEEMCHGH